MLLLFASRTLPLYISNSSQSRDHSSPLSLNKETLCLQNPSKMGIYCCTVIMRFIKSIRHELDHIS